MAGGRRPSDAEPEGAGPAAYAARAASAYAAMESAFRKRSGLYRRDAGLRLPGTVAHVWPFARAMVATLDLAGVTPGIEAGGFDADAAIADRLRALEKYWEPGVPAGRLPGYASDPVGTRFGGDRYYDDNAWVGLALVQLERLRPGSGEVARAQEIYRFAAAGWDRREDVPGPGGVFWVEQGPGIGARNHDRNTVSNAPNAEIGLHLAELTGAPVAAPVGPAEMYAWVRANLEDAATGLFWDKIRGDGTIDRTLWSYNQGSMVGAAVLLARRGGEDGPAHLAQAEAIARAALAHYAPDVLERQPPSFNAIFFRNLLLLHAATADGALREAIVGAMRAYADWAWSERRDRRDMIRISDQDGLLDQSALVQILALLAWDPELYGLLA